MVICGVGGGWKGEFIRISFFFWVGIRDRIGSCRDFWWKFIKIILGYILGLVTRTVNNRDLI